MLRRQPELLIPFLPLRKLINTLVAGTTPFSIPSRNGGMEISSQLRRIQVSGIRTKLSRYAGSFTTAMTVTLYAGTVPDGASLNGKYDSIQFRPWARIRNPRADTASSAGKELWTWLEDELGSLMVASMAEHQLNDLHMTGQQIMKEVDGLQPHQGYMLGSNGELLGKMKSSVDPWLEDGNKCWETSFEEQMGAHEPHKCTKSW
ncbi:hypothetical protein BU15DRAFT_62121 [Melanogaster broomeanus]|nr:hypothetical protein BU15DRAFT_62121 [Melanogaster broomeanus]